jgi:hypothetical protein
VYESVIGRESKTNKGVESEEYRECEKGREKDKDNV